MNTTETRTVHVVKFYAATARLLSLNDGGHWATRAKNVQAWRWAAFIAACEQLPRRQRTSGLWLVAVSLPVVDRRRRDPHNFVATL